VAARGARAQQPKVPTTGFIVAARPATERDRIAAFSPRLRELGWIESRNIAIDFPLQRFGSRSMSLSFGNFRPVFLLPSTS
jgi:hypothetical protein